MVGTMIGLGCARDLFNLWVWFEGHGDHLLPAGRFLPPASRLAGSRGQVPGAERGRIGAGAASASPWSSLKAGTLDLAELRAVAGRVWARWAWPPGRLFMIGFGVKAALVPMHTWLPDAHSQAPSGISAMLSGVVIEAGLVALLRALGGAVGHLHGLGRAAAGLRRAQYAGRQPDGAAPDAGQAPAGLFQPDPRRLHADRFWRERLPTACPTGRAGGFFHLFNHAMMKGLAFLAAGSLLYALHLSRGNHNPLMVEDLNGAAQRYPLAAFALSVARAGAGRAAAAGRFHVQVADLRGRRRDAQHGPALAGHLCRAEQRAFAGLLRAAGQPHVPPRAFGSREGRANLCRFRWPCRWWCWCCLWWCWASGRRGCPG